MARFLRRIGAKKEVYQLELRLHSLSWSEEAAAAGALTLQACQVGGGGEEERREGYGDLGDGGTADSGDVGDGGDPDDSDDESHGEDAAVHIGDGSSSSGLRLQRDDGCLVLLRRRGKLLRSPERAVRDGSGGVKWEDSIRQRVTMFRNSKGHLQPKLAYLELQKRCWAKKRSVGYRTLAWTRLRLHFLIDRPHAEYTLWLSSGKLGKKGALLRFSVRSWRLHDGKLSKEASAKLPATPSTMSDDAGEEGGKTDGEAGEEDVMVAVDGEGGKCEADGELSSSEDGGVVRGVPLPKSSTDLKKRVSELESALEESLQNRGSLQAELDDAHRALLDSMDELEQLDADRTVVVPLGSAEDAAEAEDRAARLREKNCRLVEELATVTSRVDEVEGMLARCKVELASQLTELDIYKLELRRLRTATGSTAALPAPTTPRSGPAETDGGHDKPE